METTQTTVSRAQTMHLDWILPTFLHPGQTLKKVVEQEKPVWLTPMLVLSVLILIAGLVAGPIRRDAIANGMNLPASFQYYSQDQQTEYLNAQVTRGSALFTFIFPIVGSLLGTWIVWFLMGSVLHLSLTLAGSRAKSLHMYNLAAWTTLPLALRQIVQIIAMLVSHTLISNPGLSGFVTGSGGVAFLAGLLGQIDVFFIWELCLLFYGVLLLSKLSKVKAWGAAAVTVLLVMVLAAVPHLVSSMLSGVSLGGLF